MKTADKRNSNNNHTWRFFRAGGFDQVKLDSGKDLLALEQLDQKLWVALACPIDNVNFDTRTLSLIDTDGDRRVRATELITAIKWAASLLKNPDDLIKSSEMLTIQAINDTCDEGKVLVAAGRSALDALGKQETDGISVVETESLGKVLSQRVFNGDGIITDDTVAGDDSLKAIVTHIIAVLGGVPDRSDKVGINAQKIEEYFALARAYEIWFTQSEHVSGIPTQGDTTQEAADAILAVREKINDYFARCAIAEFDERTVDALNGNEKVYLTIGCKLLSQNCEEIETLPLARIRPQSPLPLTKDINPFWLEKIRHFLNVAVKPVLGPVEIITECEWRNLLATFAPLFTWMERKPSVMFDSFGIDKMRELLSGTAQEKLTNLIAKDSAESATFDALVSI